MRIIATLFMNESVEVNERASRSAFGLKMDRLFDHHWKLGLVIVALAALLALSAYAIARSQDYMLDRDFFSFWLAGRMVLTGQDPYSEAQWIAGHTSASTNWLSDTTFLYPLPLAILFAPLGLLPLEPAAVVWAFITQVALVICGWLLTSAWKPADLKSHLLPIFLGMFLFRPVATMLLQGQLGAIWLLVLSLCIYGWQRGQWWLGGVVMPLLALKPNIGLPLIGLLTLWLILRRQWRALTASALSALGLLIIGWLRDPMWLQKLSAIGNQKIASTFGWAPTVWGIGDAVCQRGAACTLGVSSGLSVLLVVVTLYLLVKHWPNIDPDLAMGIIVTVAVLITPYLWVYDQVLLIIPILAVTRLMRELELPYRVTAILFMLISILSWLLVIPAFIIGRDTWSALVPLACLGLIWRYARRRV